MTFVTFVRSVTFVTFVTSVTLCCDRLRRFSWFSTILDNLGLFATVCDPFRPLATCCDRLRRFATVYDYLRPFLTICDRLRPLVTVCDGFSLLFPPPSYHSFHRPHEVLLQTAIIHSFNLTLLSLYSVCHSPPPVIITFILIAKCSS